MSYFLYFEPELSTSVVMHIFILKVWFYWGV